MSLGSELKLLRETLNITLVQVQENTGISHAYLSQLENDKIKKPSANFLYKLSEIYKVPIDRLLHSAGIISDDVYKNYQIFTGIKLTDDEEKQLLEYLRFLRSPKNQTK